MDKKDFDKLMKLIKEGKYSVIRGVFDPLDGSRDRKVRPPEPTTVQYPRILV